MCEASAQFRGDATEELGKPRTSTCSLRAEHTSRPPRDRAQTQPPYLLYLPPSRSLLSNHQIHNLKKKKKRVVRSAIGVGLLPAKPLRLVGSTEGRG